MVFYRRLIFFLIILGVLGCQSPAELEFSRGRKHEKEKNYRRSLVHYRRAMTRTQDNDIVIKSARRGARIAEIHLNNPIASVEFLNVLVSKAKDAAIRVDAQKSISNIYFNKLTDNQKAVTEINKLLSLDLPEAEKNEYRLKLAKSYFYLRKLYQSEVETQQVLKNSEDHELQFRALKLLGNIYQTQSKTTKATEVFQRLVSDFSELAQKENIGMSLAITYEEMSEFQKAIDILKQIRDGYSSPKYIDLKISRLKKRLKNLPGAKGLKK